MQDPYLYPNTETLVNRKGIRDPQKLQDIESANYIAQMLEKLPSGNFDYEHLKAIHKHLFGNIYEWAGKERTIDIAKGNSYFCHKQYISKEANKLFSTLKSENFLKDGEEKSFYKKLAYYFSEINALHPFREGNGRTQRAFCKALAENAGYKIEWKLVNREKYIEASIESFERANYKPIENIFKKIISPLDKEKKPQALNQKFEKAAGKIISINAEMEKLKKIPVSEAILSYENLLRQRLASKEKKSHSDLDQKIDNKAMALFKEKPLFEKIKKANPALSKLISQRSEKALSKIENRGIDR